MAAGAYTDQLEAYFRRADLDGDGRISGAEAVAFFQGANLPKPVLAQVRQRFAFVFHFDLFSLHLILWIFELGYRIVVS